MEKVLNANGPAVIGAIAILFLAIHLLSSKIMINIDSRLFNKDNPERLDADELYLAIHLTNRINDKRFCFPSIKTIAKDCGWGADKVQVVKKRLEDKGVIQVKKGGGRFANLYTVLTPYLGIYLGGKIHPVDKSIVQQEVKDPVQQGGNSQVQQGGEHLHQVLAIEELNNEELDSEVLIREKNWVSLRDRDIFKILIECIFQSYDKYKNGNTFKHSELDSGNFLLSNEVRDTIEPTVRKTLEKIMGAAVKICNAFEELKRPRPAYRKHGDRNGEPREPDAWKESKDQIEAYADWCRLTKTYITTDAEKLPEKIISTDWCAKLLQYADEHIKANPPNNYDPAYDEELQSYWLKELFYWTPMYVYACEKYSNRLVFDGEEYLKSGENAENYQKA